MEAEGAAVERAAVTARPRAAEGRAAETAAVKGEATARPRAAEVEEGT